jgi:aldehyde dehydrogenase (NAD+)
MNFIDGRWQEAVGGATYRRTNPADSAEIIGGYPESAAVDAEAATVAAAAAFPRWRDMPAAERGAIALRAAAELRSRAEAIATALTREEGKPLARARAEVGRAADVFDYFAGAALRAGGATMPSTRVGVSLSTVIEPVGPVLLITPFNFPLFIAALKLGPALVAGNTVVWKPSPHVPESSIALAKAFEAAGIPPGVLNLVNGNAASLGRALVDDKRVRAISFTGSTAVGLDIGVRAAARHVRVQQEMGGKNVLIVGPGYDLGRAAAMAVESALGESGQKCTATGLVVVGKHEYETFLSEVESALAAMVIGDGSDPRVDLGPLIHSSAVDKASALIAEELRSGSVVEFSGCVNSASRSSRGCYVDPHVVRLSQSGDGPLRTVEAFAPILPIVPAEDVLSTGLDLIAASEMGLSASLLTERVDHAQTFLRLAQAGLVSINLPTTGVEYQASFGGWNLSGGLCPEAGAGALDFYTRTKTLAISAQ